MTASDSTTSPGTIRVSKAQRQHQIAKLLEEHRVTSQAQVVELLAKNGFEINISTVSRDLEDLGAIKVRLPGGDPAYAIPELPKEQVTPADHLRRILGDWLVEVQRSGDLVVAKTPPGSAHVVGSALDRAGLDGVLGTIAGDDTLLLVTEPARGAEIEEVLKQQAGLI